MVHNFSSAELAQSVEEVEAKFIAASKKISDYHALSQSHIGDAQEMHRMEYLLKLVKTQAGKYPKKVVPQAAAKPADVEKAAIDFDLDDNQGDNF